MHDQLQLGELTCHVQRKHIKHLHLSVRPPMGRVTVSAPMHLQLDTIRAYLISKLSWIQKQQLKMQQQERLPPLEYIERESHYLWGKGYLLSVKEALSTPKITRQHDTLLLTIRPGTEKAKRQALFEAWYREQLKIKATQMIRLWERRLGVQVKKLYVRRMKTKWGSCTYQRETIRLNTELARKPKACLEYLVVHEMVHLLEPSHNKRFYGLMDFHLPNWKTTRDILNNFPLSHDS
jgi:predicted metal-dependent hydrolase